MKVYIYNLVQNIPLYKIQQDDANQKPVYFFDIHWYYLSIRIYKMKEYGCNGILVDNYSFQSFSFSQ